MKKRCLSLLLAALMAIAVMLPLTSVATAAAAPTLRLLYTTADGVRNYMEYMDLANLGNGDKLTAAVDTNQKIVYLRLKNYQTDRFGLYLNAPDKSWSVLVSVSGSNELSVQYNELTKSHTALGTNGAMVVYPIGTGDTLNVNGVYGAEKQQALTEDYYAFRAESLAFSNTASVSLNLNVNFNLNLTGYTSKEVYPFKVNGKNKEARLANVMFSFSSRSNYTHANPENTPIVLDGKTYFYTYYVTDNATNAAAFHTLKYADTFTGLLHIDVTNGYYYGGAYAGEYNTERLAKRYLAKFDNIWRYHAIAQNCAFPLTKISTAALKSAFSFPLAYGYILPAKTSGAGFDAKVVWTEGDNAKDLTGAAAEYGTKYKATISIVPFGFNEAPTAEELIAAGSAFTPAGAYSFGQSASAAGASVQKDIFVRYSALIKPALQITQQPQDYEASGSDRQARFTVEVNDPSVSYQWQMSKTGGSSDTEWTNLSDRYTTAGTVQIAGAKGKTLIYDFNTADDPTTPQRFFRCVIVRGTTEKVVTRAAKYTYTKPAPSNPIVTVSSIRITGFNSQIGSGDSFYNSPSVMMDGYTFAVSWSGYGDNYLVEIVDGKGVWYEGAAGASVATPTADTTFREGKTYTFRVTLKPTSHAKFADSMTILQDGTGRTPDKITKMPDGRWLVDFTFGPIGEVIRRVYLYAFAEPYNGMGALYPTVQESANYKIEYGFSKAWYDDGSMNALGFPLQIGKKYYMNLYLYTGGGNEFDRYTDTLTVDIRDRDGLTSSPDKIEKTFPFKNSDGSADYTRLLLKITYECKATHVMKAGTIKDLDAPVAGKPLDTAVDRQTPQIDFQEMYYLVNGERVDTAKYVAEEGDIVKLVFTYKEYGTGESRMYFDKDIYTTWYIGGNDADNGVRVYRDTGFEDSALCAFTYTWQVTAGGAAPVTFMLGDVNGDGGVTTADARLALRKAIDLETYAPESREFKAADVNADGNVTTGDARFILRHAIGLNDPEIVW